MRYFVKASIISISIILIIYVTTTWKDYQGMFEYNALCEKDAGLHVYEKLEKKVGWEADYSQRVTLKDFTNIAFMRTKNAQGQLIDVTYKGGPEWEDESYNIMPANFIWSIRYRIERYIAPLKPESNLFIFKYKIIDVDLNKVVIEAIQYSYRDHPLRRFLQPLGLMCCPQVDVRHESFPNYANLDKTIFKD